MAPLIGITASMEEERKIMVTRHYSDWLLQKGAIPVIIPHLTDNEKILAYTNLLDGLLLSGGGDIDPTYFQQETHPKLGNITPERDLLEIVLVQEMLKQNKPILAICRGCQILNVAAGGDMYQDLSAQFERQEKLVQHQQKAPRWHATHTVNIEENSKLYAILGVNQCKTNSFHHQAIKNPAPSFKITARSMDGVIEAIESETHTFAVGVQWHPECMELDNQTSKKLFSSFVKSTILI